MHIVYYITSHGYGHGVRSAAICNAFSHDVRITFRTALPERFFREEVHRVFSYAHAMYDCGCLQSDSINSNIEETLSTYRTIAARNSSLLEEEARWCRERNADIIVSDITPFAFDVAHRCAIPSVAVTNFTWLDIYSPYIRLYTGYAPILDELRRQYSQASMVLALEPALPMDYFKRRMDIPPVGRNGRNRRAELAARLQIDPNKHIGIIYLGEFGLEGIDWQKLVGFAGWEFVGVYPLPPNPANYHLIAKSEFPYQDLLASADIMIGKLGYGAVAECMLQGIPIMYLPRDDFAEYAALDAAVRSWGGGHPLSLPAFLATEWDSTLNAVLRRAPPAPVRLNGARLCAKALEALAESGR